MDCITSGQHIAQERYLMLDKWLFPIMSNLARLVKADLIILRQNSPACGCGCIYDGTFTGTIRQGNGVTTALLLREKFRVLSA